MPTRPNGRIFNEDPDDQGSPMPIIQAFEGGQTGLNRQDGNLLTKDASGPDSRRSVEDLISAIGELKDGVLIAQELLSAVDRLSGLLALFRSEVVYDEVNIPAPGANTDIIKGGIVIRELPYTGVKALEVTATVSTGSVLNYTRVRKNSGTLTIGIFESVALNSGDGYGPIRIEVSEFDTINFRVETDGIISQLHVKAKFQ